MARLIALMLAIAATILPGAGAPAGAPAGFIHTDGNRFLLNGREYRAVGMCNYPFSFGNLAYIERTTRRARAAGITLIRACLTFDDDFAKWDDEEHWQKIDWLLKICAEQDMHVMIDLSGFRSPLQRGLQIDCWAEESYPHWDALVDFATSRVNRFTHVAYRDDPVIFQWLISGEPVPFGFNGNVQSESRDVNTIVDLLIHVAEQLQEKAPNQLVSAGGLLHMNVPLDRHGQEYWKTLWSHPAIDCGAIHIYLDDYATLPGGSWTRLDLYKEYCDSIGKPFVLEEWGIDIYQNNIDVAQDYYRFGFDATHDLSIPITINWNWAPFGGFSVFPGHGEELLAIVSENTRRWGYEGPIWEHTDPLILGETLWSFEAGSDAFFSTGYGGNNGAPQRSTIRASAGGASLRVPVAFESTNWDFAGITRRMTQPVDWSDELMLACDVWIPEGVHGLVVKFIITNDDTPWRNYAQRAEINNWLEGGKWNTVYAPLGSPSSMDWWISPPRFHRVSAVTMEIHHSHGTPTFSGDLFVDNFRILGLNDLPQTVEEIWIITGE